MDSARDHAVPPNDFIDGRVLSVFHADGGGMIRSGFRTVNPVWLSAGLPVRPQNPQLAVTSHRHQGREILFVANPTAETINSSLDFAHPVRLTSLWGAFAGADLQQQHPINLEAFTIAIVEVQHD